MLLSKQRRQAELRMHLRKHVVHYGVQNPRLPAETLCCAEPGDCGREALKQVRLRWQCVCVCVFMFVGSRRVAL